MASSSRAPVRPGHNILTDRTQIESEALEKLAALNISPGDGRIFDKLPPGTLGNRTSVKTNVYQALLPQDSRLYRYDVDISGTSKRGKLIEFTKRSQDSVVIANRIEVCRACYRLAIKQNQEFFGDCAEALFYDLQSILFTKNSLPISDNQVTLELDLEQLSSEDADPALPRGISVVNITIKKARNHTVDFGSLDSIHDQETGKTDRSLLNIVELVASQLPMFNEKDFLTLNGSTSYIIHGVEHQLPETPLDQGGTKYLAAGVKKSAVFIEGYDTGKPSRECKNIGVMVQTRRSPFHSCKSLTDYIRDHSGLQRFYRNFVAGQSTEQDLRAINRMLQGITFAYNNRSLKISAFASQTAQTVLPGLNNITIAEYFIQRYNIRLEYPDAHLVIVRSAGSTMQYPPERLIVADNQLVTSQQMDARIKARMVEVTAVRPDILKRESEAGASAIHLHDSPYTAEAGIKFSRGVLQAPARRLPCPSIQYKDLANNRPKYSQVNLNEAAWKQLPFLRGAKIQKYSAYLIGTENDTSMPLSKDELDRFFQQLEQWAKRFGMCIGALEEFEWIFETDVDRKIGENAQRNTKLVYFISPEYIKNSHEVMKNAEHKYDCVVTQDIRVPTVKKVVTQAAATLDNIISKTNLKLGGINYSVKCGLPEFQPHLEENLFIGISYSQPGAKTAAAQWQARDNRNIVPGVLGFCGNICEDWDNFAGDFVYIDAYRNEIYKCLSEVTSRCVSQFIENRRRPPKSVVFYYAGASYGQYENILKLATPLIKHGIGVATNNQDVPLCLICVSKDNNLSVFPNEFPNPQSKCSNGDFNVPSGTVIDERIVHPLYTQFFLVSHTAIKGSARVPRYTVLVNEADFSMDLMQAFSFSLCHEHQIIGRATALPTPTVVAEDYANRGQQVFKAAKNEADKGIYVFPRSPDGNFDLEKLSADLSYDQCRHLRNRRVNA